MEYDDGKLFKQKLDEILNDTDDFVNASRQLRSVKMSLEKYVQEASALNEEISNICSSSRVYIDNVNRVFGKDFSKEVVMLTQDLRECINDCKTQAEKLQESYEEILQKENYDKLQRDHLAILSNIGRLQTLGASIQASQTANSAKLDRILALMEGNETN